MAWSELQRAIGAIPDFTNTPTTLTLASAPTPGNLLILAAGLDKNTTIVTPAGFTKAIDLHSTSTSLEVFWKVADGSEQSVTCQHPAQNQNGPTLFYAEFTETSQGDWQVAAQATNVTNEATTTSWSTGTTGTIADAGRALAFWSMDSWNSVTAGGDGTVTNGYTLRLNRADNSTAHTGATGGGGLWIADRDVAAGATTECTWTRSGTADQTSGAVLVFSRVASSGTGQGTAAGTHAWTGAASGANGQAATPTTVWRWVGGVNPDGATVTAKVTGGASARLKVSTTSDLATAPVFGPNATVDSDGYVRMIVSGLTAATDYYYGIEIDGTVDTAHTGQFPTAPSGAASFTFVFGSCNDSNTASNAWARSLLHNPDLCFHTGDLHYANIGINDPALFRTAYDGVFAKADSQAEMHATVPTIYVWSDHDFGPNNAVGNSVSKPAAQATYRQCVPHYPLEVADAIYHTFTYGRVRFIVTDERSFKSAQGATDDASKTVLGATQKAWFKNLLDTATEPLIIWVGDTPWPGATVAGDDHWASYDSERQELAAHIASSPATVVRISGDQHCLAYNDGTLDSPGNLVCFSAAPWAQSTSVKGSWTQTYIGTGYGRHYGVVSITDDGNQITADFNGYDEADDTTAAVTYSVAAAPSQAASGSAAGGHAWTGTSAGLRATQGAAAGEWAATGAASGERAAEGQGAGSTAWAGSATGAAPVVGVNGGAAVGGFTEDGSATGTTSRSGSATGAHAWTGTATSQPKRNITVILVSEPYATATATAPGIGVWTAGESFNAWAAGAPDSAWTVTEAAGMDLAWADPVTDAFTTTEPDNPLLTTAPTN